MGEQGFRQNWTGKAPFRYLPNTMYDQKQVCEFGAHVPWESKLHYNKSGYKEMARRKILCNMLSKHALQFLITKPERNSLLHQLHWLS